MYLLVMVANRQKDQNDTVPSEERMSENIVPDNLIIVLSHKTEEQVAKLPDLSKLKWPHVYHSPFPAGRVGVSGNPLHVPQHFEPMISKGQRAMYEKMLRLFSDLMFQHGLGNRFMLHAGTLLGSFRHHDRIPWDDDLDVLVDITVRPQVQKIIRSLGGDYKLTEYGELDKFYKRIIPDADAAKDLEFSRRIPIYPWGFPFIDIFYYHRNSTHIYQNAIKKREYPIDMVFPLLFRPLGMDWFPTPFKAFEFIRKHIGTKTSCSSTSWSHSREKWIRPKIVDCSTFQSKFAFVRHSRCDKLSASELAEWGTIEAPMIMGREELILVATNKHERILHSLCFPMYETSSHSQTYAMEPAVASTTTKAV